MELDEIIKSNLEKCGEIKTALTSGKEEFFLVCTFCDYVVFELEAFMSHINTEHRPSSPINSSSEEIRDPLEANNSIDDEIFSIASNEPSENNISVEIEYSSSPEEDESIPEFNPDDAQFDEDNNKTYILALIREYKNHRLLWDGNDEDAKNRRKRDEAVEAIVDNLNRTSKANVDCLIVKEQIRRFRCAVRRDLLNQRGSSSKKKKFELPWYYNKLAFLKTNIICKKRDTTGMKGFRNEKPVLPFSDLTDSQTSELIEIYKSFSCLWDVYQVNYRFKNRREEAFTNMQATIKSKMGLHFSMDELQKRITIIRHACTQEKRRKMFCERMKEPFKPVCKYYNEINFLEDKVGPFQCNKCEALLRQFDSYRTHLSSHGIFAFTCPLCDHGFKSVGNFTVHLRRHTREYQYECEVCKKQFAASTDFQVHMRRHTGEKPYFCDVCGQSYRTWTFFNSHMKRHQKRADYKCELCSKSFYEGVKLREHMKAHLNVRDKECDVCGKGFTSGKLLRQHKQIHTRKKRYVCKICEKGFAQYAGLSGHMKSHGTTLIKSLECKSEDVNRIFIDKIDNKDLSE